MDSIETVNRTLLEEWLGASKVDHYTCDQCEGLHLRSLQELEGVIDSRLFLESYGLLLTTELEIRPMALLPLSADLGRLNMEFPTLKMFLDVVDDATPQLVVAGTLPTSAGITLEQFATFVAATIGATRQLASDCQNLSYLFAAGDPAQMMGSKSLH